MAAALTFVPTLPSNAEDLAYPGSFANHIDVLQGYRQDAGPGTEYLFLDGDREFQFADRGGLLVFGYHFTAVKWGRVRTLGLGVALGVRGVPSESLNYYEQVGQLDYMVTTPIADIRLTSAKKRTNPDGSALVDLSLSIKAGYNLRTDDPLGIIGFALSF